MAQVKPLYEELSEFGTIAAKLVEKFPDIYKGIDLDAIKAVAVNNKERSDKRRPWEIIPAKDPLSMFCSCSYCVVVYLSDWVEMGEVVKNRLVADILFAIPDDNQGINPFDLKGYSPMIKTFGVDFLESEEGLNPLAEGFEWTL